MSECDFRMWSFLSRIFCPNETKSHCKIEQWKIWSPWPCVNGLRIVSLSLSTGGGSINSEFLMKLFDFSIFGMGCCSIFSCPTCKWWFRMCLPRHFLSENVFSHWLQLTLDLLWAFIWAVKKLFRRNDFWHILQECGLSLEWILLCSFRWLGSLNVLAHSVQLYGLSVMIFPGFSWWHFMWLFSSKPKKDHKASTEKAWH